MVFEGILVDVLNRILGPYVKNLDASQLKVGIWGGAHYLEYPSQCRGNHYSNDVCM